MRTRPLIGVTLDSEPAGGWSKLPWYALRQNYFDAVIAAGGLDGEIVFQKGAKLMVLDLASGTSRAAATTRTFLRFRARVADY